MDEVDRVIKHLSLLRALNEGKSAINVQGRPEMHLLTIIILYSKTHSTTRQIIGIKTLERAEREDASKALFSSSRNLASPAEARPPSYSSEEVSSYGS